MNNEEEMEKSCSSNAWYLYSCWDGCGCMADDGSEKGYTYNYDYWGDISYSPDAYRTIGVYTSVELGLDKSFSSAEGMYVKDNSVYICDTGNNRIVQLERTDTENFEVVRIIDSIKGDTDVKTLPDQQISVLQMRENLYL